jgi:hypothetical protein
VLNRPTDHIDIDSPVQTMTYTGRVSPPSTESWVISMTNTDTPMPNFNNLVMNPDTEVLNINQNIFDLEEQKFY